MKWLDNLGGWFWVFAALLAGSVLLSLAIAALRATGPWRPIERPLSVALCALAGLCPMVGLAGTVQRLKVVFPAVASVPAEDKQHVLADGIAAAMDCTAIGLGLAVPLGFLAIAMLVTGSRRDPNRRSRPASG